MEPANPWLPHRRHPPEDLSGGSIFLFFFSLILTIIIKTWIPRINHPEDDGGGGQPNTPIYALHSCGTWGVTKKSEYFF